MKIIILFILVLQVSLGLCNDGAFFARGGQLIPIVETDISVKKEVLTIKRTNNGYLRVTVSYIFDNPAAEKELLVGFEAPSPFGDVDGTPVNGQHPYISNFSVNMNGIPIRYEAAIVNSKTYYTNGTIDALSEQEAMGENFNVNDPGFYYVYHFKAKFKKGINTVRHTYQFKMSSSVMENYSFGYILTAANRWANNGIDDFTLIIDLGDFQNFLLSTSFFKQASDWALDGKMIALNADNLPPYLEFYKNHMQVYCNGGPMVFTKQNFHPAGELNISAPRNYPLYSVEEFDFKTIALPFDLVSSKNLKISANEKSYKILRNLPYARRGYVFKTDYIQSYYTAQPWYVPRPNYISNKDDLTEEERLWLDELVKL